MKMQAYVLAGRLWMETTLPVTAATWEASFGGAGGGGGGPFPGSLRAGSDFTQSDAPLGPE